MISKAYELEYETVCLKIHVGVVRPQKPKKIKTGFVGLIKKIEPNETKIDLYGLVSGSFCF